MCGNAHPRPGVTDRSVLQHHGIHYLDTRSVFEVTSVTGQRCSNLPGVAIADGRLPCQPTNLVAASSDPAFTAMPCPP
jgi:hypothetical protein